MNALAKISRNMTLTGDPASPGEIERRIRASQIDVMFTASTMAVLIGYFAALLLAILMIVNYGASILAVEIWIALHSLSFLVRFAISFLYRRRDAEAHNEAVYAMAFAAASMASALAWSLGSHFILCPTGLEQETIANLSLLGLGAGAVLSLCSYAPALFAYFLPLTLPVLGFALRQNDTFHQTFSGLAAAFIAGMLMLALRWNVTLSRSLRLDLEKRELIDDLSEQKELAVKANQSKSRFLAAASHDLRQPVHALSMFVGALRERALDPGSARLVEQITGSIETLDTLFGSLLDISRLDAGVVSHREEDFAIEPLIARVCDDFAIDAQSASISA